MRGWRLLGFTILLMAGLAGAAPVVADGNEQDYRFTATVIRVADGDTVTVRKEDGSTVRIRLLGIDAPEVAHGRGQPGQPAGQYAKAALEERALNQPVLILHSGNWSYDRLLGHIILDGVDQCQMQVRIGAAWQYDRYSDDPRLAELEQAARADGLGIWSRPDPVPPWTWRRMH